MEIIRVAGVAFTVSALLIPLFAWLSLKIGLIDTPNARKIHDRPIPLVGGLAVCCGVVAALIVGGLLESQVLRVLLASLAVVTLGILDDRLDLRSTYRLIVQIGIAAALCHAGVRFHLCGITAVDWAVTILWIVGTINALNCIDCADGMAGATAMVIFAYFAATAAQNGRHFVTQLALAGAAAVAGFLLFNRPRARVFLGDTGSTFLGLLLASLSLICVPRSTQASQIPWPALALLLPFYDLVLVHARRYRSGLKSIRNLLASTGKDHLPHRLLGAGLGPWGSIYAMVVLAGLPAAAAWFVDMGYRYWMLGILCLILWISLMWQLETGALAALATGRRVAVPRLAAEPAYSESSS
jgi:UDP-GlcNAc:undecaprenyl-phosphate GlcNAc-1-phosphate transferase